MCWVFLGDEKERGHVEDLHVNRRIILKLVLHNWYWMDGMDWVQLAEDRG